MPLMPTPSCGSINRLMSKYRRAARIDDNQNEIVNALRDIPGVTVETGKDDILVGYQGKTYWFEIKNPDTANKAGIVRKSRIKETQHKLLNTWSGHYEIVINLDQILIAIGATK